VAATRAGGWSASIQLAVKLVNTCIRLPPKPRPKSAPGLIPCLPGRQAMKYVITHAGRNAKNFRAGMQL